MSLVGELELTPGHLLVSSRERFIRRLVILFFLELCVDVFDTQPSNDKVHMR